MSRPLRPPFAPLALAVLATVLAACGGGASKTIGIGTISVTAFSPTSIPGGVPTPFTLTGTNFETVSGTTAVVRFEALGGETPFADGTSATAQVVADVTSDTTITGITPAARVCGVASIAFEVTVTLESGVTSDAFAGGGGPLVFTAPTVTGVAPASIPAEIATTITVNGTGFGPIGETALVRFVSDGGFVLFGDGSLSETTAAGTITSATAISVIAPLATVCGASSRTASIGVTLPNGSCTLAPEASVLTYTAPVIVSTTNPSVPALDPAGGYTITGSGFGPVGATIEITFVTQAGGFINGLFQDGASKTISLPGVITSPSTITGNYPPATTFGGTNGVATVRAEFPAGSCANSPASFVTFRAPVLTAITTAQPGNALRETLRTPLTLSGTDFSDYRGAIGGPLTFRFSGGGTLYAVNALGLGTATSEDIDSSVNAISSPVIQATAATPAGTTITIFYPDGSFTNGLQVTWAPPPLITGVVNANPPFDGTSVSTLQAGRFLAAVNTQMNITGTSFDATASTALVYKTGFGTSAVVGTGALGATVTRTTTTLGGQSPTDGTLLGNTPVTVRVTNPDGQFGEASTLYVTDGARPNTNASFDTGTNSENQIAVNPANPLNAVALAHQIATGGFANMNASVTVDGGLTWTKVLIGDTQDGIVQTFRGDPMVGFDTFGNCYINYISTGGGTDRIVLLQFAPTGGAVTSAVLSALAANVRVLQTNAAAGIAQDRNTLSVGGTATTQTIAVGWIDFFTNPANPFGRCAACTSTGAGVLSAVTGPVNVANAGVNRFTQHFAPCVGPQGQVYVTWGDYDATNAAGSGSVLFVSDLDGVTGGLVFGATVTVGTHDLGFRTFITAQSNRGYGTIPMCVAVNTGPKTGRLVVTYADEVPAVAAGGSAGAPVSNNTVVVTLFSDTQGLTWSSKTFVRPATLDHHFLPWLGVDKANGNVYVTWKETADQPTKNQSVRFCASSTDGVNWNAPLRLSQGVATPFAAFGGAAGDYLEYEGIAVFGHRAYAVWADNANFTATGATANPHGTTTSDAYVTVFQHKP